MKSEQDETRRFIEGLSDVEHRVNRIKRRLRTLREKGSARGISGAHVGSEPRPPRTLVTPAKRPSKVQEIRVNE